MFSGLLERRENADVKNIVRFRAIIISGDSKITIIRRLPNYSHDNNRRGLAQPSRLILVLVLVQGRFLTAIKLM